MKKQLKHIVVNINDLKPAAYNPREELHPGDPEYENIKNSIQEFGYVPWGTSRKTMKPSALLTHLSHYKRV